MEIPPYDQVIEPLLRILAQHPDGIVFAEVRDLLAAELGVKAEQRKELLPSGRYPVFANRVGWAHDRLKRAGLSHSIKRGTWCLTTAGKGFAAKYSAELPPSVLKEIAYPKPGSSATGGCGGDKTSGLHGGPAREPAPSRSPEEAIHAAMADLNQSLAAELLESILRCSPSFFEGVVLDLLLAMGYGASRKDLQQTGRSGDGGIDGVITLDKLGLEKVYIQAKRYKDNSVGSAAIRNFYGGLAERKATRGVFITTSTFSKSAVETARRLSDSVVLVDGPQLARFMIEHEVGCTVAQVFRVARIDSDYFEDLE